MSNLLKKMLTSDSGEVAEERQYWVDTRRQFILTAMEHDKGELRGEKSQAGTRAATMRDDELERFEAHRETQEASAYKEELQYHATMLAARKDGLLSEQEYQQALVEHSKRVQALYFQDRILDRAQKSAENFARNNNGSPDQTLLETVRQKNQLRQNAYDAYFSQTSEASEYVNTPSCADICARAERLSEHQARSEDIDNPFFRAVHKTVERVQTQRDFQGYRNKTNYKLVEKVHQVDLPNKWLVDLTIGVLNGLSRITSRFGVHIPELKPRSFDGPVTPKEFIRIYGDSNERRLEHMPEKKHQGWISTKCI